MKQVLSVVLREKTLTRASQNIFLYAYNRFFPEFLTFAQAT